jgi:very-short-patch-repair endonuclease
VPRQSRGKTSAIIVRAARELRQEATDAETRLWDALQSHRLAGLKFRRQHPYERFVLDFFCVEHQLAVELDGGVHAEPTQAARDAERTEFLQSRGIRVLRFKNETVENEIEAVLKQIKEACLIPHTLLS